MSRAVACVLKCGALKTGLGRHRWLRSDSGSLGQQVGRVLHTRQAGATGVVDQRSDPIRLIPMPCPNDLHRESESMGDWLTTRSPARLVDG